MRNEFLLNHLEDREDFAQVDREALRQGMEVAVVRNALFNKVDALLELPDGTQGLEDALVDNLSLLNAILCRRTIEGHEGFCPWVAQEFPKDSKVRFEKGTLLRSLHPARRRGFDENGNWRNGYYHATRAQTVIVHHRLDGIDVDWHNAYHDYEERVEELLPGVIGLIDRYRSLLIQTYEQHPNLKQKMLQLEYAIRVPAADPSVVWAGAGGYWVEASVNDVEKVQ